MNTCISCGKDTCNKKFCSKSCAASFNNKANPKRVPTKMMQCRKCGDEYYIAFHRRVYCQNCIDIWDKRGDNTTLAELAEKRTRDGVHRSWWYSEVRYHCRRTNSHRPKECQVCGYTKHIERCHIKPISSFHPTATLSEINDPSNIYILCPNHHWELDHGILNVNGIRVM